MYSGCDDDDDEEEEEEEEQDEDDDEDDDEGSDGRMVTASDSTTRSWVRVPPKPLGS